jgi:5-methylcytosine-specific restriction protein A
MIRRNPLPVQCRVAGCPHKALEGARCPAHRRSRWTPSGGYGWDWRRVRDAYIRENPICEWPGCSAPAEEVDHIIRVKVDPSRRLDPTNLRALCLPHHRSRTGRDGGRARVRGLSG